MKPPRDAVIQQCRERTQAKVKSKKRSSYARKDAARKHAMRRAKERWGVTLSRADVDYIIHSIQKGLNGVELLVKQSCSRSLFDVPWKSPTGCPIMLPTVYNTRIQMLCTVLPRGWREHYSEFICDRLDNTWLDPTEIVDLSEENLSDGE